MCLSDVIKMDLFRFSHAAHRDMSVLALENALSTNG